MYDIETIKDFVDGIKHVAKLLMSKDSAFYTNEYSDAIKSLTAFVADIEKSIQEHLASREFTDQTITLKILNEKLLSIFGMMKRIGSRWTSMGGGEYCPEFKIQLEKIEKATNVDQVLLGMVQEENRQLKEKIAKLEAEKIAFIKAEGTFEQKLSASEEALKKNKNKLRFVKIDINQILSLSMLVLADRSKENINKLLAMCELKAPEYLQASSISMPFREGLFSGSMAQFPVASKTQAAHQNVKR